MQRERLRIGNYFTAPRSVEFFPSGCTLLDLALGGGWAECRIINIVGDKSSGKTLLCIESCANFAHKYSHGKIFYRECESAFDLAYAKMLGLPVDRVSFGAPIFTVEELFDELTKVVASARGPTLYILDSLDALSDKVELERDIAKGSYGATKAAQMSELFRRLNQRLSGSQVTVMIVSQVRDKIGVTFGTKTARSGGRALDFYASQVVYLSQLERLKRTIDQVTRVVGIEIRAKLDKNKVGLPFREAQFPILFGYGIDDQRANLKWLKELGHRVNGSANLPQLVEEKWRALESRFLPRRRKYEF